MHVPLGWLGEFIELPTTDVEELTYAFDMLGLTVESVQEHTADWTDVYVGVVTEVTDHPDADKIRVCEVDTGSGPEQIICGAWNFDEGAMVAVAKPGAVLPGGFEIGTRSIRGVESNGMICSERELGLGEEHGGILVLDGTPEIGAPIDDIVEVPDLVFELEVTPNRPDALSIFGVARDLGAWFGVEASVPPVEMTAVPGSTPISVRIDDPVGCRRFTAREIRGVKVGQAPLKVRHRLHKVGVRSISNVVDVTNYVMFELGHPLHAFDADSIVGERLIIRRATAGETLVTLDDEERELVPEDLIIYDDAGPTSMSGTMGGARSEVSASTTRVLMEAASWDPPTIMRMWRRHDLRSEAATRFERGVDPNLADAANQRASSMVMESGDGEILEGAVDEVALQIDPIEVTLALRDVERILGSGFTSEGVSEILVKLGMGVSGTDPLTVTVPTYRPDITRDADLIEEIARIHGFDKFEATIPIGPAGGLTIEQRRLRSLNEAMTAVGLDQAISLPFVSLRDLRALEWEVEESDLLSIDNPLRDEEAKLRPTLLPGLLEAIRYNLSHGASDVAFYEIGRVFSTQPSRDDPRLPDQVDRLAWAAVGGTGLRSLAGSFVEVGGASSLAIWRHLASSIGIRDITVEQASPRGYHPGRTAALTADGAVVGHVGELAPGVARAYDLVGRVAVGEIELEPLLRARDGAMSTAPSVYPFVDFDLSFLMSEDQAAADVLTATGSAAGDLLESARVFDEFLGAGEDKKAIAIRYRLRAPDRTLTNEEVAPVREQMIAAASELGAELRGVS